MCQYGNGSMVQLTYGCRGNEDNGYDVQGSVPNVDPCWSNRYNTPGIRVQIDIKKTDIQFAAMVLLQESVLLLR
ncbi:hypothetical protein D3C87_1536090 [compost metagenome]